MASHVEHSRIPKLAVGAVVVDSSGLLLVRRAKEPWRGCWAVPGGKVHWGETMTAAVRREVEEETGLLVEVGEIVWTGEAIYPAGRSATHHNVLVDFSATVVGGLLRAGSDAAEAAFVPLAEACRLHLTPTMHELLETLDSGSVVPREERAVIAGSLGNTPARRSSDPIRT